MSVRAKFKVVSYSTSMQGQGDNKKEMRTVSLSPVYSDDKNSENGKFWQYTPSGEIKLGTINPSAWEQFELDKEYYVDFTPADG